MITNLGHCGHMIRYILNIPDTITSQDMVITSAWYIQNILGICRFGIVLVHRPRPYNVLAMYWVSTSPLAPSVSPVLVTALWGRALSLPKLAARNSQRSGTSKPSASSLRCTSVCIPHVVSTKSQAPPHHLTSVNSRDPSCSILGHLTSLAKRRRSSWTASLIRSLGLGFNREESCYSRAVGIDTCTILQIYIRYTTSAAAAVEGATRHCVAGFRRPGWRCM
jgi:hypothetical protein